MQEKRKVREAERHGGISAQKVNYYKIWTAQANLQASRAGTRTKKKFFTSPQGVWDGSWRQGRTQHAPARPRE